MIRQSGLRPNLCKGRPARRPGYRYDPLAAPRSSTCTFEFEAACRSTRDGNRWQSRTGKDSSRRSGRMTPEKSASFVLALWLLVDPPKVGVEPPIRFEETPGVRPGT